MSFKKFLRYTTSALVLGAILILGFLAFSGMYVLTPILALAISAFILSVIFEGEIFYQNISKAINSLVKPHYIESKLAEECLQEAISDINKNIADYYFLLNTIDAFINVIDLLKQQKNTALIKKNYKNIQNLINNKKDNLKFLVKNSNLDIDIESFLNDDDLNAFIQEETDSYCVLSNPTQYNQEEDMAPIKKNLLNLKNIITSQAQVTLQFFIDYAQIATVDHKFSHINPDETAEKHKKSLQISLSIMEQIFAEQLFPHTQPKKTTGKKWWWFRKKSDQNTNEISSNPLPGATSSAQSDEYKQNLRKYLEEFYYKKYHKMLPKRKFGSRFIKVLSTICAGLMILGTSYLLVEAFAVVPFLAAIPFGVLPAIIIPLAVLAGIAYGMQTYRALDEILNSDVITQRIAKIKADIKEGLNLYTGAKLFIFIALLGLAITLTVCTGGTWYTILRNTKPLFSWLSKIPAAVTVVIAGFLAVAAFAFNISNSAQTAEELEEAIESQVPEDHPYNIDLLELDEGATYEPIRTTIVKQNEKYYIYYRPSEQTEWSIFKVHENHFFLNLLLNKLNFKQKTLYYSVFNSRLYRLIKWNTAHIFIPSKENWTQFFNPFRIILLVTYVPIRIVFFLGHLVSICATSDRIPGIPEIISMIIGFIAELFEDLHYFTSFSHSHKSDLPSVVTEHFKEEDSCDHANDLPTRILRDYLFYPVFMAAAWWHSRNSKKEVGIDPETNAQVEKPSISYENALETMRGKQPKSNPAPELDKTNLSFLQAIEEHLNQKADEHRDIIDDQEDLINISTSGDELITTLAANKSSYGIGIFTANKRCCGGHPSAVARSQVLRQQ